MKCPCCCCEVEYLGLFPKNPDTYLTDVSPMWVSQYKCKKCNNISIMEELVDETEFINLKRTRTIDKMLNG